MNKKISSALISVFYKDGLEPVVKQLKELGVTIYSTGGTQKFIEELGIEVVPVEQLTGYPPILDGRVKTLHPSVFGGILGRRDNETDVQEMQQYKIAEIDLVIVDLYPFEETLEKTNNETLIIEKIDIGGPSMIRAAAKNFKDVTVIASKDEYQNLVEILRNQNGEMTIEQRKNFAVKAFQIIANYDCAIANYFKSQKVSDNETYENEIPLRYGENPHQSAIFYGHLNKIFDQLHGKKLSYNNLVDVDAAVELISEFSSPPYQMERGPGGEATFAIIKHTNVCGIASKRNVFEAWKYALAGDPESAFGGVLICNRQIDFATAAAINEIFFEVLIAPSFEEIAVRRLTENKNRILLKLKDLPHRTETFKTTLNGTLEQQKDIGNYQTWNEVGGYNTTEEQKEDLIFANLVCKHLKSNAIALVKNKQLIGKGCGQTSRIDALRQAIEKSKQFNFDLNSAVMASDAFFPFNDCVKMGHEMGITAFIQPGGSIRDKDSIDYCKENNLAMVLTGMRHFRH
ncbi:MAG: bifunctional phosphoribosylaminoimidazolecarboxamide formyltransferase/IMP cyclohydrolase [Chitinophagaceae bacterium]|nr:bifunctional phosphoribosylaminoimidazolecarboxamide formyltransferase/IMP cyclohydrolase [Chitinophagaceae bacterium]